MKKSVFIVMMAVAAMLVTATANAGQFTLKSDDVAGQLTKAQVFSGFGCTGDNISPELRWVDAPPGTKSFAVTVYDPDAPTGSGWWHWVIFNIPADTMELKTNAGNVESNLAPAGSVQSLNDYGTTGFGGACPPKGDKAHRYVFTVYALGVPKLDLDKNALPALVGFMLNSKAISKASLISYYQR